MDTNVAVAIVSTSATALIAIVAILNNNKRLDDTKELWRAELGELRTEMRGGFERIETEMRGGFERIELLLKMHEAEHHHK